VHEEEEVIFHRPLQPEWGCFAPPLMLDDVLLKYEAGFQECGQGSVCYWGVVFVPPSVAYEDGAVPVWFETLRKSFDLPYSERFIYYD